MERISRPTAPVAPTTATLNDLAIAVSLPLLGAAPARERDGVAVAGLLPRRKLGAAHGEVDVGQKQFVLERVFLQARHPDRAILRNLHLHGDAAFELGV